VDESDRLQALASLEIQETERVLARSRRDQARTVLRAALLRQSVEPDADFSLADPPPFPAVAESLEEALRMGLDRRPDIAAARARVESAEWAFRITKLDTLPELHAEGSYGVAGLDRTYSEAWDDLGTWDHPVKSAGVSLSVPFGFRKERLERTSARLRLEEAKSEHEQAVQRVLTEIRTAWEFWQTAQTRLGAAGTLVDLERKKLKAESEDFERGRSSTDLLVRFQQDLHRARRQLVQAEVDEYLARADLARATGLLADVLAKISGGEETE
jgi:outer membrane protein TolC